MKVIACDLGGTRIKVGLVEDGQVLSQDVFPALSHLGLAPRLPVLADALWRLLRAQGLSFSDCGGIAVSFPSLVDCSSGRILAAYGKYHDAMDIDLRSWARDTFGLPLAIENDARMALIGEWRHGAGRGCDDFVLVTLGTGIGTSALIGGRVLRGRHGQAGCLSGHLTVRYGGRPCSCGNVGCAEAEASSVCLSELARSRTDFLVSGLAREPVLDYEAVFRLAVAGDVCALALREHSLFVWSTLVVNLITAYDPVRVVVGGGILASAEVVLPALQRHVDCYAHTPQGPVEVVRAELGDASALLAAEWLLQEQAPVIGKTNTITHQITL